MKWEVKLDGVVIANKSSKKKDWLLVNEDYFVKVANQESGNISKMISRSNVTRGTLRKISKLTDRMDEACSTLTRQQKTKNNTVFYDGYEVIRINGKPKRYHRHLMERKLGRALTEKEIVHHIDCDKTNNRLDNLYLCKDTSEHNLIHDNLEKLAARLINAGVITFCPDIGEYIYVHTFPENSEFIKNL